jgi:hypothetical protein
VVFIIVKFIRHTFSFSHFSKSNSDPTNYFFCHFPFSFFFGCSPVIHPSSHFKPFPARNTPTHTFPQTPQPSSTLLREKRKDNTHEKEERKTDEAKDMISKVSMARKREGKKKRKHASLGPRRLSDDAAPGRWS